MAKQAGSVQYVLLPARGLRAKKQTTTAAVQAFFRATPEPTKAAQKVVVGDGRSVRVRVVDSIGPDGAKLIEASPEDALAIRSLQPGIRVVPVTWFEPAWAPRKQLTTRLRTTLPVGKSTVRVVSRKDATPIRGAFVLAFTDLAAGVGAQAVTNAKGEAKLNLGATTEVQALYVYPVNAFWTLRRRRVNLEGGAQVSLRPLDLAAPDAVRHYYGTAAESAGEGVVVGIVDTGCGPHPDLVVAGAPTASRARTPTTMATTAWVTAPTWPASSPPGARPRRASAGWRPGSASAPTASSPATPARRRTSP